MNKIIWYELADVKKGEIYLSHILLQKGKFRKRFQIWTLIFSGSGVLGWAFWASTPLAGICCALVLIMQLILKLEIFIVRSEKDLDNISELRRLYLSNFNKLVKLYDGYISDKLTKEDASKQYYKIKDDMLEAEKLDDQLKLSPNLKFATLAEVEAITFLNRRYHSNI